MSTTIMNQDKKKSVPKVCNICNKQPYSLKQHMKVHDVSKMFQQTYMPEELVPELKKMGKVKLDNTVIEGNCVCPICLKIYCNWIQRRNHEKLHEDAQKHKWFMRNKSLETKQVFNLSTSASKVPSLIDSEPYNMNWNISRRQEKNIVQGTNYPYKCNICDRGVTSKESLEKHMNIHKCQNGCDQIFPTNSILKVHMKGCDQIFSTNSIMKMHMTEIHRTKKRLQKKELKDAEYTRFKLKGKNVLQCTNYPYKCNICDRGVTSKESLEKHMNIHKCQNGCDQIFPTNSILKVHMIEIHGPKKSLQ
jgi:hypothetical protein